MTKSLIAIAAAALMISGSAYASETITFDTLAGDASPIPNGYAGLNWTNFGTVGTAGDRGGYQNAIVSSPFTAFNLNGTPATISVIGNGTFDLDSGYFTAAWNDALDVEVAGYYGDIQTYTRYFAINPSGPILEALNLDGITSVTFTSYGGTPDPLYAAEGGGTQFAMDNVVVDGVSAAPEPSTWALMIAGAGMVGAALRFGRRRGSLATV